MKIQYSTQKEIAPDRAVMIDHTKDVNYYETLCLYCAENDVNLDEVTDEEFNEHVSDLSRFGIGPEDTCVFWFWA